MSEFLAEATVLIRPDTTKFRALLIAELAAATKGIVVPVSVVPAGGASGTKSLIAAQKELAAETKGATAAGKQQATVQRLGAASATRDAAAQEKDAVATAKNAIAHEQLARGAGATGLSLLKVRGATLAASTNFLIGAAAVTLFVKSIQEAVKEEEAVARATRIFGDETGRLRSNAQSFISPFALDAEDALAAEAAIGNVIKISGVGVRETADFSENLVKLAADMAAFRNIPLDDTLHAIQLGLAGNSRGLRQFGVDLGAAAVNAEALRLSGKHSTDELTRQDRVLARINILFAETTDAQGAAARRAEDFAQQSKILSARVRDLGADLGHLASGPATEVVSALNDIAQSAAILFDDLNKVKDTVKTVGEETHTSGIFQQAFGHVLRFTISPLAEYKNLMDTVLGQFIKIPKDEETAGEAFANLRIRIRGLNAEIAALLAQTAKINFQRATSEIGRFQDKLLDLEFRGGSSEARISALQGIIDQAQTIIVNPPSVKAKTEAKQQRNQAKQQIDQIIEEQKRDREDIANKAEQAARDIVQIAQNAAETVAKLLAEADQAVIDSFGVRDRPVELAAATAAGTQSLQDDIRAEQLRQQVITREIAQANSSITDEKLKAETIHRLTIARIESRNREKELHDQEVQAERDRKAELLARQRESLDLDIDFFQTTKNLAAERKAHEAKIRFLIDQQNHTKKRSVEWKRLRNEIAAERAAIEAIDKELGARRNAFREATFEFLQAQQGFAANLASNLIPGGATAGLVGGGAVSTPSSGGGPSRPPDVGAKLGAAAQTATGPQGATQGQLGTLIQIQRAQLLVLQKFLQRTGHPEAIAQKSASAAAADIFPW